jgi:hypothetical protein
MEDFDDIFDDVDNADPNLVEQEIVQDDLDIFGASSQTRTSPEDTILDKFLTSKGIVGGTFKVLDETDAEKDVNFFELPVEEQLDVLNSLSNNSQLGESEEKLISFLKANNLTITEYLDQYKDAILREAQVEYEPDYDIDAYDDQELYLLDLKAKFDLTDEELAIELEKELKNEDLFTKKVAKLRAEYKDLEDQYKAQINLDEQNKFKTTMNTVASSVSDFHGIILEDFEKNETLDYLTKVDEQGRSSFYKDLSDPKKMYEAAWYLKYGKDAFKAIEDAYEAEISKLRKDAPRVVVRNSDNKQKSIHDLTFF